MRRCVWSLSSRKLCRDYGKCKVRQGDDVTVHLKQSKKTLYTAEWCYLSMSCKRMLKLIFPVAQTGRTTDSASAPRTRMRRNTHSAVGPAEYKQLNISKFLYLSRTPSLFFNRREILWREQFPYKLSIHCFVVDKKSLTMLEKHLKATALLSSRLSTPLSPSRKREKMPLMKRMNNWGSRQEPWGTSYRTGEGGQNICRGTSTFAETCLVLVEQAVVV